MTDVVLLLLLTFFALRGWARGLCRETFGLAGLLGGAVAAVAWGTRGADWMIARHLAPPELALLLAWAAIFVLVSGTASLVGRFLARLLRALFLGGLDRVAGVVLGAAKGAALLGFGLLAAQHVVPSLAEIVAASRVARPLTQLARTVLEAGRGLAPAPAERTA